MTTALPLTVPANQTPHTHLRRQDLSQLVAGLSGVLGGSPFDSLVLYTFGKSADIHMATTLVGALPPPSEVDSLAARALAAARLTSAVAVIAVVVGGEAESPQPGPLPYRTLVATLRRMFDEVGIVLVHASWVRQAKPGEPWRCYDDLDCHDTVPDEVSATLAAAAAVAGVGQFTSREDLAKLLVQDDESHLTRRSRLFDAHLKRPGAHYTGEQLAADLQLIKETVEAAAQSSTPPTYSDSQLVRLAHAIAHEEVRDDCLAIALSPDADAAERVWLTLVRALPSPERAEASFLLAVTTYLRGEVVVAALAMEAALEANPGHPMASILRANLCAGTSPTHLRAMLIESVIRATEQRATLALYTEPLDDPPPWETNHRPTDPAGTTPTSESRPTDSVSSLLMAGLQTPEPPVPGAPEFPDIAGCTPPLAVLTQNANPTSPTPPTTDDPTPPPPTPTSPDAKQQHPARQAPRTEPATSPAPVIADVLAPATTPTHAAIQEHPAAQTRSPTEKPPIPIVVDVLAQSEPEPPTSIYLAPELPDTIGLLPLLAPGSPRVFGFPTPVSGPSGPG